MKRSGSGGTAPAYDPLLYALVHTGTPGDVEYYRAQCEGANRVLELGCGFGRVLVELLAAGHQVVGLDLDAGLLDLARQAASGLGPDALQRAQLVQADMRSFSFSSTFDRILIPHSGLYCLLDDIEVEACLRAARAHLAPQGRLVLDAYAADSFHTECLPSDLPEDHLEEVALIACDGQVYDVYERSAWNRETQRLLATYVYVPEGSGQRREYAIDQRYLLRAQLESLLSRAGLEVVSLCGDFKSGPYDEDSETMVVVAASA